ncbi:beta-glucanase [Bacillus sp. FJAT-26390]|nr:beta-glucanase [Bacillus sp. FJAT-26390]
MKKGNLMKSHSFFNLRSAMSIALSLVLMLALIPTGFAEEGSTAAQTPQKPFPQQMAYTKGTIKPNHVTQNQMNKEVVLLYKEWKKKYVKANPYDAGQYYVWYNDGGWNDDAVTVSEAHGYGMLITAIMAGADPDAKKLFDGMYRYFRAHPSQLNPDLMAWQQADRDGAIIDVNGADSAIDGDMDIAYSLLLADKQWGSAGAINYRAEGIKVINAIMDNEVHPEDHHLQLGDWVKNSDSEPSFKPSTRPSDFMLQHMKEYGKATGDARWDKVLNTTYGIMKDVHANYSPGTGLLPDFLYKDAADGKYKPVNEFKWKTESGHFLESEFDGAYNYNSCRTPWRITTDYLLTGDKRAYDQLSVLNKFVQDKHDSPDQIWSGYSLDGKTKLSEWDGGLDFTAPLMVSAMIDSANQEWLNDLWDYHTDAVNPTAVEWRYYYGNSIRLLSMIVVSGNWWSPTGIAATDISGHWAENDIITSLSEGIVSGFPNGAFKPDSAVKRAELAVMTASALKLSGEGAPLPFNDNEAIVPWAKQSVGRLVQADLLKGWVKEDFLPSAEVTRSEAAVLLAAALKLPLEEQATSTGFSDDASIPDSAKPSIKALGTAGVNWFKVQDAPFQPNASLTRAEAVTILRSLSVK